MPYPLSRWASARRLLRPSARQRAELRRKARKAARLAREDPRALAMKVQRRARRTAVQGTRRTGARPPTAGPTKARATKAGVAARLALEAQLDTAAERGCVVLTRKQGFEEKRFVATLAVQTADGTDVVPGKTWKFSGALGGHFMYLPHDEEGPVTLPFTPRGEGVRQIRLLIQSWGGRRVDPAETFGEAWLVYEEVRRSGAAPHRFSVTELTPAG